MKSLFALYYVASSVNLETSALRALSSTTDSKQIWYNNPIQTSVKGLRLLDKEWGGPHTLKFAVASRQ